MLHHIFVSIFVTLSAKLCLDVMAIDLEVGKGSLLLDERGGGRLEVLRFLTHLAL